MDLIFSFTLCLILLFFSLIFAEEKKVRAWLIAVSGSCAIVSIGLYLEIYFIHLVFLSAKINLLAATILASTAFISAHIVCRFTINPWIKYTLLANVIVNFVLILFTDLYFTGKIIDYGWGYYAEGNSIFFFTPLSIFIVSISSLINLLLSYKHAHPLDRNRIVFLTISYIFLAICLIDFIPHFGEDITGGPISGIFIPLFLATFSYSSIRYKIISLPFFNDEYYEFDEIIQFLCSETVKIDSESQLWNMVKLLFSNHLNINHVSYKNEIQSDSWKHVKKLLRRDGYVELEILRRKKVGFPSDLESFELVFPLHLEKEINIVLIIGQPKRNIYFSKKLIGNLKSLADLVSLALAAIKSKSEAFERHKLEMVQKLIERDLFAAQAVQNAFLPKQKTFSLGEIDYFYQSSDQTGGDWFGYFEDVENKRIYFLIGDVTGHGVSSALVTGAVAGATLVAKTTLERLKIDPLNSLKYLANQLNHVVGSTGSSTNRYMTMAFICISTTDKKVFYLNAGHNPVYLFNKNEFKTLLKRGSILGMSKFPSFDTSESDFDDSYILFAYTDGLIENENKDGKRISARHVEKILRSSKSPEEAINAIRNLCQSTWIDTKLHDDCSFVAVKLKVGKDKK